jgi:hypothetical protein
MAKGRSMNKLRLEQIINAYGSEPGKWPSEERDVALDLLADSKDHQALQQSAKQLDDILYMDLSNSAFTAEQADQVSQTVTNLVQAKKDRPTFLEKFISTSLQPTYAIAFSTLVAVLVGLFLSTSHVPQQPMISPEFDDWMLVQLTGIEVYEEQTTETGFMALVELEVEEDARVEF